MISTIIIIDRKIVGDHSTKVDQREYQHFCGRSYKHSIIVIYYTLGNFPVITIIYDWIALT